jgi:hypothetical protein
MWELSAAAANAVMDLALYLNLKRLEFKMIDNSTNRIVKIIKAGELTDNTKSPTVRRRRTKKEMEMLEERAHKMHYQNPTLSPCNIARQLNVAPGIVYKWFKSSKNRK